MIEMRRLKNVVIFIQMILSFVLSKKSLDLISAKYDNLMIMRPEC